MKVLLIDWLGRGGIAHCTTAWGMELTAMGVDVEVVTRHDTDIVVPGATVTVAHRGRNRVKSHLALVRLAAQRARASEADVVVVQNYLIPALERPLLSAASRSGARVIYVVHNHRPHAKGGATTVGLRSCLQAADEVVAHSTFVAERLPVAESVTVVPLPVQIGMVDRRRPQVACGRDGLVASHFGSIGRANKGTDVVESLDELQPSGWSIELFGAAVGAGPAAYLSNDELVRRVRSSDVVLLPYVTATQSAALVLAQACGAVVVATDVGALAEQVGKGEEATGVVLSPRAGIDAWVSVLDELRDAERRSTFVSSAWERVWSGHDEFVDGLRSWVGGSPAP